ncbi:MAG TPA: prenyltransferase/squalene oxidase repeat-containing protein [Planctomycetota bacterium]|nr:prenyltransferase/squalene oxidase repeat-containing protein [Planctomycetota bacterium]
MPRLFILPVLSCLCATALCAVEDGPPQDNIVELTPKVDESIEKGCAWLAKNQGHDGSWGSEGSSGQYKMVMTGLSGLALLSAGNLPGRGRFGSNVVRAAEYCLKHAQKDGLITSDTEGQTMYGHGFAMTFLAEMYGMDPSGEMGQRIKTVLTQGVKKTGQSQSMNGGWYYSPNSGADEGSVTVTQVQALRSCRNAGIDVPAKLLNDSVNYLVKCQNGDGGIRYSIQSGQTSSVALSAAGVACFLMAGRYNDEHAKKCIEYLKRNLDPRHTIGYHDFYTNFYGAQAMFQIGGESWSKYYPAIRDRLLTQQNGDGSWRGDDVGSTYRTAIATMILALPYRYLPIFQK